MGSIELPPTELLIFVGLAAVAIGLIIYSVMPRGKNGRDTLKRRLQGQNAEPDKVTITKQAKERASSKIAKKAAPMLERIIMPVSDEEQSMLRMKLTMAGFRSRGAPNSFLGAKTAVMVVGLITGMIVTTSMGYGAMIVVCGALFGGGFGFIAPGVWLDSSVKKRQEKIVRGLPDILDLLVVSVESGLALDAAIKRVGDEMSEVHPELSEEFRIATRESQMGIPRSEALENMSLRCGVDELRSLISVVGQAERFGTSISKALRNQGIAMRTKRRQQAEERAQKTAVKLMIPLVMFIFPAMGVVLAGPAALRLMEAFAK